MSPLFLICIRMRLPHVTHIHWDSCLAGLSAKGWAAAALVDPLFDLLLFSSYTLTALCTTSEATATTAAEEYSTIGECTVKAYHGDNGILPIVNDPEVDLVAISVKIPDHYKAVVPAIEAGKDIFIEWTAGNGYEQTLRIAEAAKRKGVRMLVGAQGNYSAPIREVKKLLDSGKIGRVLSTTAVFTVPIELHYWGPTAMPSTVHSFDINNGANMITIPIGHFLVILTATLGDFTEVTASGAVQVPSASLIDAEGKLIGETISKNVRDRDVCSAENHNFADRQCLSL